MTAPPAELIGRFGEYFASQWLRKDGFEVRRFLDFHQQLRPSSVIQQFEMEEFVPEDERRRRLTDSYTARIQNLEMRLAEAEQQTNLSQKVKNWVAYEREHLHQMKQALADVKEGKPLDTITEYPTEYPAGLRYPEPWRVYEEVKSDAEAREFLGAKVEDFMKYLDECASLEAEQDRTMWPDIVAKKNGELYIIEVKANTGRLALLQRKALQIAAKYGFKTRVIRVRLSAECSEDDWDRLPRETRKKAQSP